ncbi:hypothetical protein COBT_001428 [Conglomerata obtusa]
MIITLLIGLFLGTLLSPLIEIILLYILAYRKPKPIAKPVEYTTTPTQEKILFSSTHTCTDLAWFNISLQRYFLELSQSYAYKEKLKRTMMKKFKQFEKYVTVEIDDIDVGREFPVFTSVKVMSEKMIQELVESRKKAKASVYDKKDGQSDDENSGVECEQIAETFNLIEQTLADEKDMFPNVKNRYKNDKSNINKTIVKDGMITNTERLETEDLNNRNFGLQDLNSDYEIENLQNQNNTERNLDQNTFFKLEKADLQNQNDDGETFYDTANEEKNNTPPENIDKNIITNIIKEKTGHIKALTNEIKNNTIESLDYINYNNLTLLFEMEYKGTITVSTTTTISKNLVVPSVFTLNYLKGPVMVRLPALLNHTRVEFSIINIDKLEFLLESNINNKYLKKTSSNLLHNIFLRVFKRTYVFPFFFPQYLPSVIPSMREIKYVFCKIENEKMAKECLECILMFMSMDFKVLKGIRNIIYRKGNYYVNSTKNKLSMSEINIKKIITEIEFEKEKSNKTNKKKEEKIKRTVNNDSYFYMKEKLMDKELTNDFFRFYINELELFKGTISGFIGIEIVGIFKMYTKIMLKFVEGNFLFNRINYDDCVIFQSDESNEFFSFKLRNLQILEIFSYVHNEQYLITERRVIKFRNKLEGIKVSTLNHHFNGKSEELKNFEEPKKAVLDSEKDQFFKDFYNYIISYKNDTENTSKFALYKIKDVKVKMTVEECQKYLDENYNTRFKLNFEIFHATKYNKNLYDILSNNLTVTVITYVKNNVIIDIIDKKIINGYCIDKIDGVTNIKIFHNLEFLSTYVYSFMYSIKITERLFSYYNSMKLVDDFSTRKKKFEKDYKLENSSLLLEIEVNSIDEFYFYIYSKTKRIYELERIKITGETGIHCRKHLFIIGSEEKNIITIFLNAKYGNLNNNIKIYHNYSPEYYNEWMYDTYIELNKRCKFKKKAVMSQKQSLFWEQDHDTILGTLTCNKEAVSIGRSGLLLLNENNAVFNFLNKISRKIRLRICVGCMHIQM